MTTHAFTPIWQHRFLALATHISQWSKDPSTRCGAVIVRPDKTIASTGYNGLPRHTADGDLLDRDRKLARVVHAEANAILHARERPTGYSIFSTHYPCTTPGGNGCSALIIQSGITAVYVSLNMDSYNTRWHEQIQHSKALFEEANILVTVVKV